MKTTMGMTIVAALALTACTAEQRPQEAQGGAPSADVAREAPPASPPPAAETAAPPVATSDGDLGMATFAGYGDVKFGTPADGMEQAWGGALKVVGKEANARCYFMTPAWAKTPAEFNFMVSEGRFARFGTESAKFAAPGGGKVGMREAELQALYNHGLQAVPHKYVEGGKYLSIAASGVAPTRLVFETDAQGLVTEWRVGLSPEVDYVEGCS